MKLGIDIVEVDRLRGKPNLWEKLLTKNELDYINKFKNPEVHIAGFFAAKEAFSKAIGYGFSGFSLKDLEIIHNERNKPYFRFSEHLISNFSVDKLNVELSISHEKHYAVAVVLIEEHKK